MWVFSRINLLIYNHDIHCMCSIAEDLNLKKVSEFWSFVIIWTHPYQLEMSPSCPADLVCGSAGDLSSKQETKKAVKTAVASMQVGFLPLALHLIYTVFVCTHSHTYTVWE